MAVFVHAGFGKVEAGFFVLLVAGEFLAHGVAVVFEGGVCAQVCGIGYDLFAKRQEVSTRHNLAQRIHKHTRRAKLICNGETCCRVLCRRLAGILRDQFAARIDKDGFLIQNTAFIFLLLYTLALAVVEVLTNKVIACVPDLSLLVVAIKYKRPAFGICREIAVLVKRIALPAREPVRVRIDRRMRDDCLGYEIRSRKAVVSKAIP